ncbi:MAG: lipoprotein [Bacteriophage sp.]|nr:MAG: lipoprotein [Bacteriophage sp.]
MKTIKIILLACLFFAACESTTKRKTPHVYTVTKIVKGKKEATETSYHYKYNLWRGDFYHVPKIYTAYYLIYTDGRFESVDLGQYETTNIGDTLTQTVEQF